MFIEDLNKKSLTFKKPRLSADKPIRLVIYNEKEKKFPFILDMYDSRDQFKLLLSSLEYHWRYKFRYQQRVDGKWIPYTEYKYLSVESTSEDEVRYKFFESPNSKKLVVVFSGNGERPAYNYVGSTADLNTNRLFILDDFSEKTFNNAVWYVGHNRKLNVMDDVYKVIKKHMDKYSVTKDDVICAGTSKGGFASIHFALRFGFRNVVTGSPTIFLGDDILKYSNFRDQATVISGGTSQDDIDWMNQLIPNQIENASSCDIHMVIGSGERRYHKDVLPLVELCKSNPNIKLHVTLEDFSSHSKIGTLYPKYAKSIFHNLLEQ